MPSTDDQFGMLIDTTFQYRAGTSVGTAVNLEGIFALVDAQGYQLIKVVGGTTQTVGTVVALDFIPTAGVNASTLLQYDGSKNLGTVVLGIAGGSYKQTLTYGTDGATLTGVSAWGTV